MLKTMQQPAKYCIAKIIIQSSLFNIDNSMHWIEMKWNGGKNTGIRYKRNWKSLGESICNLNWKNINKGRESVRERERGHRERI